MRHPRGRSRLRIATAGASVLVLLLVAPFGRASLVRPMDLGEMTRDAGRVVLGEVLSVRSDWDAGHRWIYTRVELQIAEAWKGTMPRNGRLAMVQPGGSVGDIEMRVHGSRAFQTGDRAVLFLSAGDPGWPIGLGQGQRLLRFDRAGQRWMVDAGDRSAVWRPSAGSLNRPVAAPEETAVPLDDLRKRVRALVRP